jgi:hypothetical protein
MIETTVRSLASGKRLSSDFSVTFLKRVPVRFALEEDRQ